MSDENVPAVSGSTESGPTESGPTEISVQLRWADMDINGHVNNVQYARLFEEGRVRAFTQWFGDGRRLPILLARQDIEFRAMIETTRDPVRVRVGVSRLGTSSFVVAATCVDSAERTCAIAETTMILVDSQTNRPTPIGEDRRTVLERHLVPPVSFHRPG